MSGDATVEVFRFDAQILITHLTREPGEGWLETDYYELLADDVDDEDLGRAVLAAMYPSGDQRPVRAGHALYPGRLGVPSEGMVLNGGQSATIAQRAGGPVHVDTMNSQGSKGAWTRSRGDFTRALEDPKVIPLGQAVRQALEQSHRVDLPRPEHA